MGANLIRHLVAISSNGRIFVCGRAPWLSSQVAAPFGAPNADNNKQDSDDYRNGKMVPSPNFAPHFMRVFAPF
jgi:hypothetical protein